MFEGGALPYVDYTCVVGVLPQDSRRVYPVGRRDQSLVQGQVRCGEAKPVTTASTTYHRPADGGIPSQQLRSVNDPSLADQGANGAAADHGAGLAERLRTVGLEPELLPQAVQIVSVAFSPPPKGKVGADPQFPHLQVFQQSQDEIASGCLGQLRSEGERHHEIRAKFAQQLQFLRQCGQIAHVLVGSQQLFGVSVKSHHPTQMAGSPGAFYHFA